MIPVPKEKIDRLLYFLKGDKQALLFCLDLLFVAHLWDDLIDLDKERTGEDINQAFIKSLAEIPANPFYQQCQAALLPMMANALTLYLESNELAKGNRNDKVIAFSIMHSVTEIIHFCILAKGNIEWAREVGPEFWQLFGADTADLYDCIGREEDGME